MPRLRSIDWNPLGTLIATGADKTLRVWNPERPNVRYSTELNGHEAGIEKVAFNPVKDTELCSISGDGVLKVWDVRTRYAHILPSPGHTPYKGYMADDWKLSRGCVNQVKGLGEAISLVWHPDGESMIVGNKVRGFREHLCHWMLDNGYCQ